MSLVALISCFSCNKDENETKDIKNEKFKNPSVIIPIEDRIYISNNLRWATITYWEYREPYEYQYHALENNCSIYYKNSNKVSMKREKGFCISNLELKHKYDNRIKRIYETIQDGIELTFDRQSKIIILENKCLCKIYIACPSMHIKNNGLFKSKMLMPNEKFIVYDAYKMFNQTELKINSNFFNHLYELNTINISFGKYWGYNSKIRKSIELCPCWLNISINEICFNS